MNVGVVSMDTDRVLIGRTVLVESGRITTVGPSRTVVVLAGATRIDGRGKYLLPGLADLHFHFSQSLEDERDSLTVERVLFHLRAKRAARRSGALAGTRARPRGRHWRRGRGLVSTLTAGA